MSLNPKSPEIGDNTICQEIWQICANWVQETIKNPFKLMNQSIWLNLLCVVIFPISLITNHLFTVLEVKRNHAKFLCFCDTSMAWLKSPSFKSDWPSYCSKTCGLINKYQWKVHWNPINECICSNYTIMLN